MLESKFYAEGASFGDINGDGKNDVVYGPFWFEGPDFTKRHAYYEPKEFSINGYSDNFFAYVQDLNGDGLNDILILGFPGKEARLYLNPGKVARASSPSSAEGKGQDAPSTYWPMHIVADVVDDESPEFTDLTGDGKPEIVCAHGGQFGYFEPDWKDVTKPWTWHPVSDNVGAQRFTHGLGVGDVNGDGRMDLLEAKRWWEEPAKPETPSSKPQASSWKSHTYNLTGGGAQMFAYDFNGDGRNDIVSSLQAHGYGVAWFESKAADPTLESQAAWQKHLIVGKEPWENEYGVRFSQPHARRSRMWMATASRTSSPATATGRTTVTSRMSSIRACCTGFRRSAERQGAGVEFVPHLIDGDTGVGTQLVAGDIDGDGLLDVVVGNKYGCRVLLQRREEVSAERYAQFQPKKIYGPDRIAAEGLQVRPVGRGRAEEHEPARRLQGGTHRRGAGRRAAHRHVLGRARAHVGRGGEQLSASQREGRTQGQDRILIFEDKTATAPSTSAPVFLRRPEPRQRHRGRLRRRVGRRGAVSAVHPGQGCAD